MKRLWQSLAQRICAAVKRFETDESHIENQVDAIVQDAQRWAHGKSDLAEFRKHVSWHLQTERRIGRWEGADAAKAILKPYAVAIGEIENVTSYEIHTTDGPIHMMDGTQIRAALDRCMEAGK